ncbi:GSCFA domain-containing protein [uncultured Rikenella sp.]|uniref:GSCFA domain-containing protein n=1 Tax=uncultured Rikenella sp. TaxID=368003 RepID=UPI00262B62E6|nr:GSCFA domain-containing protein [uncultured Rikenella sp.]
MEFRTPVDIPETSFRITSSQQGLVLGSCFAEHVGGWLRDGKLPVCVNPFGVLYNPASIAQALERLEAGIPFSPSDLFEHRGLWHSFGHHGDFSGTDPEQVLTRINAALAAGAKALREAAYLMLTLGTAWVYERQGSVVANCHKLPAGEFVRRRMTVAEIVERLAGQIGRWPDKQIVLTVSPAVHRGDGLVENQLSKSSLIVAVHELASLFPGRVHYFPAYEIVTGELRDYRFYAEDMCHPSPRATEYVCERFAASMLAPEAAELIAETDGLKRAMAHRPLHPESPEYVQFRAKMRQKAESLQQRYKNADFSEELRFFG